MLSTVVVISLIRSLRVSLVRSNSSCGIVLMLLPSLGIAAVAELNVEAILSRSDSTDETTEVDPSASIAELIDARLGLTLLERASIVLGILSLVTRDKAVAIAGAENTLAPRLRAVMRVVMASLIMNTVLAVREVAVSDLE